MITVEPSGPGKTAALTYIVLQEGAPLPFQTVYDYARTASRLV